MNVDKDKFDALLHSMMQAPPEPKRGIKTTGKAKTVIPAPTPQPSEAHKASGR